MSFYRLVEVKRPRERVNQDQKDEIAFLVSIGVPARVLRLIER
ncbi:VRR-NUC domain-containing protein [Sulfitobacter sediminilitoris]